MNNERLQTIEQVKQLLAGSEALDFGGVSVEERGSVSLWLREILCEPLGMEIKNVYYVVKEGKQRMVARYTLAEDFKCKYCGSKNLWLYGKYKGSQRFYCRDCKRKFAGNLALPKMQSPVSHVGDALQFYCSGMPLNEVRQNREQQHNYSPSVSTIYR
jgi:transcription elongation factor Elf1